MSSALRQPTLASRFQTFATNQFATDRGTNETLHNDVVLAGPNPQPLDQRAELFRGQRVDRFVSFDARTRPTTENTTARRRFVHPDAATARPTAGRDDRRRDVANVVSGLEHDRIRGSNRGSNSTRNDEYVCASYLVAGSSAGLVDVGFEPMRAASYQVRGMI